MARQKRVEEESLVMDNITLDDSIQEMPMREISTPKAKEEQVEVRKPEPAEINEPINCLRNERVIVRFVPRPSAMVQNPKHILYGGMAENATRSFVVPRLNSTGMFKNVLTDNEKTFLERAMGLEYNALSIYR